MLPPIHPCPPSHPLPKGQCLLCLSLGYRMSHALPLHCIQAPFVLVMFMLSVHPVKPTDAMETCLFLAIKQVKLFWLKMQKEMGQLEVSNAQYQVNKTT